MIGRRQLLGMGLAAPVLLPGCATPPAGNASRGRLLLVGGAEDRVGERVILRRFVELCGGPQADILLLTAASGLPERIWQGYEPVFRGLGAQRIAPLDLRSRQEADQVAVAQRLLAADGVYLSGGDQRRLMDTLRGSAAERALLQAFERRGCCIGGTSAGAAALSSAMLAAAGPPPATDITLEAGLGLLPQAIVDQHFTQRRRLPRLLAALEQRPGLLGLGLDEDTALLIVPGKELEVLGSGSVTLLHAAAPDDPAPFHQEPVTDTRTARLPGRITLHRLSAGSRHAAAPATSVPAPLQGAIARLVGKPLIHG